MALQTHGCVVAYCCIKEGLPKAFNMSDAKAYYQYIMELEKVEDANSEARKSLNERAMLMSTVSSALELRHEGGLSFPKTPYHDIIISNLPKLKSISKL